MPEVWYDKKLLGTLVIAILFAAFIFYGIPYLQQMAAVRRPPVAPAYQFTEDLTVGFKILDDTSGSLLTADVKPAFYAAGSTPMGYTFTDKALVVGTYVSAESEWQTVLDMGSYVLLVTDEASSKTKYPVVATVSVPGTNETDMHVVLHPYMIHMVQRATPSISNSIYAYNTGTGAYDVDQTSVGVNVTAYDKWLIESRINIAGLNKKILGGRIYLSQYTGLTITSAYLDGTQVTVYTDSDSSDDGQIGTYITFPDWEAGTHYLQLYVQKSGSPSSGTWTLTLFEYYACLKTDLRWWSDTTASISVVT